MKNFKLVILNFVFVLVLTSSVIDELWFGIK